VFDLVLFDDESAVRGWLGHGARELDAATARNAGVALCPSIATAVRRLSA